MAKFHGGGANMNNLMRQAQKMQKEMIKAQEELEEKVVEGSAGGGAVVITMSGKKVVESVKIDPQVVDADDVEMLQDLVMVAVNQALEKVTQIAEGSIGKLAGGFNIPGLF